MKRRKEVILMPATIQKWGNSLGVRIPQRIAKKYGFMHGSEVEIKTDGDVIVIRPMDPIPTLEELMSKITPENQHAEVDFGKAEGEEIW